MNIMLAIGLASTKYGLNFILIGLWSKAPKELVLDEVKLLLTTVHGKTITSTLRNEECKELLGSIFIINLC